MSAATTSVVTTGRFATEQADKLLRRIDTQVKRTIRSQSAAEVHDLRVAIRRFVSLLAVLKPFFPRSESKRIRRGLKRLMEQAAEVRDRDIAMLLLSEKVTLASESLQQQFRADRQRAAATLAASLTRWSQRGMYKAWRDASGRHRDDAGVDKKSIESAAGHLLPGLAKDYFASGKRAVREKASAKELHQFRITAKTLRYTLDLFGPRAGTSRSSLRNQILGVQKLLGDVNDCETLRRLLSRNTGTRRIVEVLKKRQGKKTVQFRRKWKSGVSSAAKVRMWLDDLRQRTIS